MSEFFSAEVSDDFIVLVKQGDSSACQKYYKIYSYFVKILASTAYRAYGKKDIPFDDYMELGIYLMGITLNNYRIGNNNYALYFRKSYVNEIATMVGKRYFERNMEAYSLDGQIPGLESDACFSDIVGKDDPRILGVVNEKETFKKIRKTMEEVLTDEERKVVGYRLQDLCYEEIAKKLNTNEKHVRYIFSRAKEKLKSNNN